MLLHEIRSSDADLSKLDVMLNCDGLVRLNWPDLLFTLNWPDLLLTLN